jgi:adenosine deaminase
MSSTPEEIARCLIHRPWLDAYPSARPGITNFPRDPSRARKLIGMAFLGLGLLLASSGTGASQTLEQKPDKYLNSIRSRPSELWEFLHQMPKGGDIHNHISGAVYAESYVKWAAAASNPRLCIDSTTSALQEETPDKPCGNPDRPAASQALTDTHLYDRLIDAWSMRNWRNSGQSGRDHFFSAFGKWGAVMPEHFGDMLAEVASRAAAGNVIYLELMLTADSGLSANIGQNLNWTGDLAEMRKEMLEKGIDKAVQKARETLDTAQAGERKALGCDGPKAEPGCKVTVKFICQVTRTNPPSSAFAQMVAAMELASVDARVVALNLVAQEDAPASLDHFAGQMQMLDYLHSAYPKVHITLHAGELAPPFDGADVMKSHIRDSIELGHADRIGHGVDIMHEQDSAGLLKEMAERKTLVEICLTSNDEILGVHGKNHPLNTYIKNRVPVALATDDPGVSRSEISKEYLRAVQDQGLTYSELKHMARNSLEYSFASGSSLWKGRDGFVPISECAADYTTPSRRLPKSPSGPCRRYLAANEKASLQWTLEGQFRRFESTIASRRR